MNLKAKLFIITMLLVNIQLFAQDLTISGSVTDENGLPIVGVNVIVANTLRGAQSDFDGNYNIVASEGETLRFSYLGFSTQEIVVGDQTTIDVVMREDASKLDEVVIVGYGSQRKSDITGSVTSVNTEDITAFPVLDVQQTFQGRAAGVAVQSNNGGEPGAPIAISIRGNGSIGASSSPLVVVDGFVGAIFPQPNDIESVEILKDASATAIYGSQASNGVIVITTKKGKKGKLSVEFNSTYSVQTTANSLDLLNADEFAVYQNQIRANQGNDVPYEQGAFDTDWQDLIYRGGSTTNQQLSFSGGSEKINFYASTNYFNQRGIVVNSDFERLTFLANVNADVNDKFKIGLNLFGSTSNQNSIPSQSDGSVTVGSDDAISLAFRFAPDRGIFNDDGTFSTNDQIGDEVDNPFAVATERDDETDENNFRANLFAEYELFKGLSVKSTFGFSTRNRTIGVFQPSTLTITAGGVDGRATLANIDNRSILSETYLTYTRKIDKGNLTVVGGYSYQQRTDQRFSAGGTGFISDTFSFLNLNAATNFLQPTSSAFESEIQSQFARANFDWDDKYLLTGTIRRDGSSVFAENNQTQFFPSAAIGWKLSNEDFLADSNTISNLKVRASWGITGNPGIGAFGSLGAFTTLFASSGGETVNAITVNRPSNPDLRSERYFQTNIGVDLGIINNRVSLTADYYTIDTRDIILTNTNIPDFLGFLDSNILTNSGEVNNSGFELAINSINVNTEDFRWSSNFNISFNRSEVISLDGGLDVFLDGAPSYFSAADNVILREGEEAGLFWGLDYAGVFQGGELPEGTAAFPDAVAGDPLFVDVDGDGAVSNDDRTIIGNPNPDFIFGFNNTFRYKNFDLNIFFQGSQGGQIFNLNDVQLNNGDSNTTRAYFNNAYSATNTNTNQPRVGNNSFREISSRFVEDGSYVRLKNLAIGYTLPVKVTEKLHMQSLRIGISGQNLITFTDYSGLDPEVNFTGGTGNNNLSSNVVRGLDFGNFPTVRSWNFSLSAKF